MISFKTDNGLVDYLKYKASEASEVGLEITATVANFAKNTTALLSAIPISILAFDTINYFGSLNPALNISSVCQKALFSENSSKLGELADNTLRTTLQNLELLKKMSPEERLSQCLFTQKTAAAEFSNELYVYLPAAIITAGIGYYFFNKLESTAHYLKTLLSSTSILQEELDETNSDATTEIDELDSIDTLMETSQTFEKAETFVTAATLTLMHRISTDPHITDEELEKELFNIETSFFEGIDLSTVESLKGPKAAFIKGLKDYKAFDNYIDAIDIALFDLAI